VLDKNQKNDEPEAAKRRAEEKKKLEAKLAQLKNQQDSESDDSDVMDTRKPQENGKEVQKEQIEEPDSDSGEDIKPVTNRNAINGPPVSGPAREHEVRNTEQEEYIEIVIATPADLNLTNMKYFVTNPPPKGKMVQCTIMRDKTKLSKKFSPKYHVYISVSPCLNQGTQHYIMTGKKRGIKASSNYYIGTEKNNFEKGAPHLVCKLKYTAFKKV
jgi:Tub family